MESQPLPFPADPEGLRELLTLYPELRTYLEAKAQDLRAQRTVAEIAAAYLADAVPTMAAKSQSQVTCLVNQFVAAFGERTADSLTPLDLKRWIEGHDTWKSPWTHKCVNRILQRVFNWSLSMRLIATNPVRGVSFTRCNPRRPMTLAEYRALVQRGPAAFRRVLLFMRLTGCRTCEVLELTWPDVDLTRSMAVLPAERQKNGKKTGLPRVIVLVPAAVRLLAWMQRQGYTEAVFCDQAGRPLTRDVLYQWMRAARAAAGLSADTRLYGLRHLFGTEAAKRGTNQKTIATLMGHASLEMTQHYQSTLGQDVGHLLEVAQRIVGGGNGKPAPERKG